MQRAPRQGPATCACRRPDVDTVVAQDALEQPDIGQMRHVGKDQRLLGQQAGDHQRQSGVLGARDRDDAGKTLTADNTYTIHDAPLAAACGRTLSSKLLAFRLGLRNFGGNPAGIRFRRICGGL